MQFSRIPVLFFLLLTAFSQTAFAAIGRDPYTYFFNETWGNMQEELAKAKQEGKQGIFLFFEQEECPFCHRMKKTVLNQPEVQAFFRKHFLNFSIDIEGDVDMVSFKGKELTQKQFSEKINRVRATPVMAFYDLKGNQVVRYTGATSSVQEFLWLGEYFADGHYKNTNFTKFKRQKKEAARQSQ